MSEKLNKRNLEKIATISYKTRNPIIKKSEIRKFLYEGERYLYQVAIITEENKFFISDTGVYDIDVAKRFIDSFKTPNKEQKNDNRE